MTVPLGRQSGVIPAPSRGVGAMGRGGPDTTHLLGREPSGFSAQRTFRGSVSALTTRHPLTPSARFKNRLRSEPVPNSTASMKVDTLDFPKL